MTARPMPTVPAMYRGIAAWLETHDATWETLASGPLGEALTRAEIEPLIDNPEAVAELAGHLRESADALDRNEAAA